MRECPCGAQQLRRNDVDGQHWIYCKACGLRAPKWDSGFAAVEAWDELVLAMEVLVLVRKLKAADEKLLAIAKVGRGTTMTNISYMRAAEGRTRAVDAVLEAL